jgi:hypothetical protein
MRGLKEGTRILPMMPVKETIIKSRHWLNPSTPQEGYENDAFNDDVPLEHVPMCNQVLNVTANMSATMEGKRQEVRCAFVSVG